MRKQTPFIRLLVLLGTLMGGLGLNSFVLGQDCKLKPGDVKVPFERISEHRNSLPPYTLRATIVVNKKLFSRSNMVALMSILTAKYCRERDVNIAIFDDKRAARKTPIDLFLLGRIAAPELRGFYSLDCAAKAAGITFSTERGRPVDEVSVDISLPEKIIERCQNKRSTPERH